MGARRLPGALEPRRPSTHALRAVWALMADLRLELDGVLRCPECHHTPYKVFRRQNRQPSGELLETFEHVLWPATPDVAPPKDASRICCPACRAELRRVAP